MINIIFKLILNQATMRKNKSFYDSDFIKFDSISGKISWMSKIDALDFEVESRKSEVWGRKSEVGSPTSTFRPFVYLPYCWHLLCQFWHENLASGMAFQSCSVLFKDPIDFSLSCLSQTTHPNTINEYRMLSWLWRWLPLRLSKRQTPATVLFRTTLTWTITHYKLLLILLDSNHLL